MAIPENIDEYLDLNLYGWRDDELNKIYPSADFREILTLRAQYNGGGTGRGVLGYLLGLVAKLKDQGFVDAVKKESNRRIREAEREELDRELFGPAQPPLLRQYVPEILTIGQQTQRENVKHTRNAQRHAARMALEEAVAALSAEGNFSIFKPRTWCGKARCPRRGGTYKKRGRAARRRRTRR